MPLHARQRSLIARCTSQVTRARSECPPCPCGCCLWPTAPIMLAVTSHASSFLKAFSLARFILLSSPWPPLPPPPPFPLFCMFSPMKSLTKRQSFPAQTSHLTRHACSTAVIVLPLLESQGRSVRLRGVLQVASHCTPRAMCRQSKGYCRGGPGRETVFRTTQEEAGKCVLQV